MNKLLKYSIYGIIGILALLGIVFLWILIETKGYRLLFWLIK